MQVRPHIEVNTENAKPVEKFMHEVLRPILKQINEQLITAALSRMNGVNLIFEDLSRQEKRGKIENLVSQHQKFKGSLKELVVAQFSKDETIFYQKNKRDLNKRIFSMTLERLLSQLVK
jgi:hypothetical protein